MRTWPALELSRLESPSHAEAEDPARPPLTDLIEVALTDYDVAAVEEISTDSWRIVFHDAAVRDRAATALNQQFANISVWAVDIADDDWAARSQASLRAIQVGDIIVAPPWDIPSAPRDNHHVIVIQPSMGFGTGHHATTRLCLRALQQVVVQGSRVIDVGTGSGVLGIAASRLGAREVLAIDDDPDALRAAEENVALNGASNVTLRLADLRAGGDDSRITPASDHFDVVLANLTGALLSAAAGQLQSFAARQGHLILSGFTLDEETAVCQAFADCLVENRAAEEGWVCATVKRRA